MWFLIPIGIALYLLTRHPDEPYVDRNGVEWTLHYTGRIDGPKRWFATDMGHRYNSYAWSVSSTEGTKEQAQYAAEFYAQEHTPIS